MTNDFPDWQKAVMAFKGAASEMTNDYPDWVMGVAVETGSKVGGGQLIDISPSSQYYDSREAAIEYVSQGQYEQSRYLIQETSTGAEGFKYGWINFDITSLISGLTHPVIFIPLTFLSHRLIVDGNRGNGYLEIATEDWTYFGRANWSMRGTYAAYPEVEYNMSFFYVDLTDYKEYAMKLRFEIQVWGSAGNTAQVIMSIPAYLHLFDAEV